MKIYKYDVSVQDEFTVLMPEGAEILCIQNQYDAPRMWAKVDTSKNPNYILEKAKMAEYDSSQQAGTEEEVVPLTCDQFVSAVVTELEEHFYGTELEALVRLEGRTLALFAFARAKGFYLQAS